ncbi:MAG: hypothetical protein ABIO67_06285, partial [Mycobacteriales bacterium]
MTNFLHHLAVPRRPTMAVVAAAIVFTAVAPAHADAPSLVPPLPQCQTTTVYAGPLHPSVTVCRP